MQEELWFYKYLHRIVARCFCAVTANVGYWATLSLNIPDFTRYARSQKDQVWISSHLIPVCVVTCPFPALAHAATTFSCGCVLLAIDAIQ